MSDLEAALSANRDAVNDIIAAAQQCAPVWTAPRAPGKWSPSQVVEHVARVLEESANVVSGAPSKFPTLPWFLHPIARGFLLRRVLKTNAFPKAKATKAFDPASGSPTPAAARARLEEAVAKFERACRAQAPKGTFESPVFGSLAVGDYVKFMAIHSRHHATQVRGA